MIAVGAVGTPVNAGDAKGAFSNRSAVLEVILNVFAAIAFVFVVMFALFVAMSPVLVVILDVLDVTLVFNDAISVVLAVILEVFAAIAFVFVVMFALLVAMSPVFVVILEVFEAIKVGNVPIVVEFTPPTLFTVGKSAVPPRSFANFNIPFTPFVASGVAELVIVAATNAVVAI